MVEQKPVKSIKEFCHAYGISRALFYKLVKSGQAPQTIRLGNRVLISTEAESQWRTGFLNSNQGA